MRSFESQILLPIAMACKTQSKARAMAMATETALNTRHVPRAIDVGTDTTTCGLNRGVRGASSRDVHITLEHDFFQKLYTNKKKPTATTVNKWWELLKKPLDDTNVYSTLSLVRRALLDWPKMGAGLGKKAEQEFAKAKVQKRAATKLAKNAHRRWAKKHELQMKQNTDKAEPAHRHGSVKKWAVKLPHQPLKTKK
jgi:hypothetical protein